MTEWAANVASKLDAGGLILLVVGLVLGYGSDKIAAHLPGDSPKKGLIIKVIGCVLALIAALILLDLL